MAQLGMATQCNTGMGNTGIVDTGMSEAALDAAAMYLAAIHMPETRGADFDLGQTRLLGFAPLAGLDALHAAMEAVPGPALQVHRGPAVGGGSMIAALHQAEPDAAFASRGREALTASLKSIQQRLEVACQAGPFLPMDPGAACCPASVLPRLLAGQWDHLVAALVRHGACQQWDIELRWRPEDVVARHRGEIAPAAALGSEALAEAVGSALRGERDRREAALLAALGPAVLAFAKGGAACAETQVVVTVLVASGGDTAVEAALDGMAAEHIEGASIDMRGPLPPLSFFAVRVEAVEERAVIDAWATLGLGDRVDLSTLHRQWRLCAAAAHPDRLPNLTVTGETVGDTHGRPAVPDLTDAYRLLRDLLPAKTTFDGHTLASLLSRAGHRLVIPADVTKRSEPHGRAFGQASDQVPERLS